MVGKKNIVFGFLFLALTASLGPWMMVEYVPGVESAQGTKQRHLSRLQSLESNEFEEELEELSAKDIAKANTLGLLSINTLNNARQPIDLIKAGPHAHGNLEALLNITVGIVLCFIGIAVKFKQVISWVFILGTLMHAGLLFLVTMFQLPVAMTLLSTGIGPILILVGLVLVGIAAAVGFKGKIVDDST